MRPRLRSAQPGMTLVEMLLGLTLFTLAVGAALGVFERESRVFSAGNDRLSVLQNYRYAIEALEQDLQQAGAGVLAHQPPVVYAGRSVVAFNADYASNTPGDISAVYLEPEAPSAAVSALARSGRIRIPGTGFSYPDTVYLAGGVNSPAETIIFFFEDDATTDRPDDVGLFRQVNGLEPELLSGGLVPLEGRDFFEYRELVTSDTAPDAVLPVPAAALPLAHAAPTHLSVADTGAVGRVDHLRAVRINFGVWNGRSGDHARVEPVGRLIWLRNLREREVHVCGDAPLPAAAPTARGEINGSGDPVVRLTWAPAPDDGAGEGDVAAYVVWRRNRGGVWGDPYLSLPGGKPSYLYEDAAVEAGQQYEYALSVQDCTPSVSDRSPAVSITAPTP